MTLEHSKGKPRITRPRASDVMNGASTAQKPSAEREENGRMRAGNKVGAGWGWKNALKATLPDTPEARRLYRAAVRELDHDTPGARAACARWVRATLREADLDRAAVKAGVGSKEGQSLLDLARQYGVEADRAYTAALTWSKRKSPSKSAKKTNEKSSVGKLQEKAAAREETAA